MGDIGRFEPSFMLRHDGLGQVSLSPDQKLTGAMCMQAYGSPTYQLDEYVHIGESTLMSFFMNFCNNIINIYRATYFRESTSADLRILLRKVLSRAFSGMIRSIDYMHWELRNCPSGKDNTLAICIGQQSFLMRWPHITHGYDMLSLGHLDENDINSKVFDCIVN
ncbi:unnamed protein product [Linum trigynum]|uniref:Uncharacterized protein n=1 Tax=Linum trigynum TaxID=586398 RepID=A0AAV2DG38_9ROSI